MQPNPTNVTNETDLAYYDKEWYDEFRQQVVQRLLDVTAQKNNDYTTGESATNPFANFDRSLDFGVQPLTGLCIRLERDKHIEE